VSKLLGTDIVMVSVAGVLCSTTHRVTFCCLALLHVSASRTLLATDLLSLHAGFHCSSSKGKDLEEGCCSLTPLPAIFPLPNECQASTGARCAEAKEICRAW